MTRPPIFVFVLLAFATCVARAQGVTTISLSQALALAEENSPRITAARAQLEAARASVVTAGAYPNPEAEAGIRQYRARAAGGADGPGAAFNLAQPIDLPSVRDPRQRAAAFSVDAAQFAYGDVRLQLRSNVKQAYYDVLRRKAELELFVDTQRLLQEIRDRIAVRVQVGEAAKFELTRADAELASAGIQTGSARLRVTQALATLRATIAAPMALDFDVAGPTPGMPAVPTLDTLRGTALERQPVLAVARSELQRAQARLETERALRVPAPVIRGSFLSDPLQNEFGLGIALPIPLWNRREGPIAEAVAQQQAAISVLDQRRLEVLAAADAAFARHRIATQQIAAIEGGLVTQAEAALRIAESAFRLGERGFIEVLDAQRVLRGVRLDLLNARFEQFAALIEVERLLVADLPPAP